MPSSPSSPPTPIPTDTTNPSVTVGSIKIQWSGTRFSRGTSDFIQWSCQLEDSMCLNNLDNYVFEPLISCPDPEREPRAHSNWIRNNKIALTFLRSAVADTKHREMKVDGNTHKCYLDLKKRAQREGPVKQISLLRDGLAILADHLSEDLMTTSDRINNITDHILSMGEINFEVLSSILHLNSLNNYENLQMAVSTGIANATDGNPFTVTNIRMLWQNHQTILRSKANAHPPSAMQALLAQQRPRNYPPGHNHKAGATCCSNCSSLGLPCQGHLKDFCVRKGGGMAGRSITNAHIAQSAQRSAAKGEARTSATTSTPKTFISVIDQNRETHLAEHSALDKFTATSSTDFAGHISNNNPPETHSTNEWEYHGFLAMHDTIQASIDWNQHSQLKDETAYTSEIAPIPQPHRVPINLKESPFYVDSGATTHISPEQTDFMTLRPIPARAVKGVGGSVVSAIGIGKIKLHIAKGAFITLEDALYIPDATVRLISVSALSVDSGVETCFDHKGVHMFNRNTHALIASGPLVANQRLYSLNIHTAFTEHTLISNHISDLQTWH